MNYHTATSAGCSHHGIYQHGQNHMSGTSHSVHPTPRHLQQYDAQPNHFQTNHELQGMNIPRDEPADDDDIGDEFSEDELHEVELFRKATGSSNCAQVDVTKQLLQFADVVNQDIQKYFGKNKDSEDRCDIYEDKWAPSKSGRELYYADLVRVAQGADDEDDNRTQSDKTGKHKTYTGTMDPSAGIGPFSELFAHLKTSETNLHTVRRDRTDDTKTAASSDIPMNARKLPISFFTEPTDEEHRDNAKSNITDIGKIIVGCTKAPDFSDLLESWTGEETPTTSSKP